MESLVCVLWLTRMECLGWVFGWNARDENSRDGSSRNGCADMYPFADLVEWPVWCLLPGCALLGYGVRQFVVLPM
ncbi:hypothetical protein Nepgr_015919 [Nepenthes gracilis]|uniref:Uncharacterized protein n=1 Tax=Nepenthes gracilis TaxID=150966 RepID=A0AAD3SMK2_NEPGR|nr:hypothetical protein Nepgr_015919 [Nepenthes gracilis]